MGTVDEKDLQREIHNLSAVFDQRLLNLERQQSEQHGENKQALLNVSNQLATGQRQMAVLVGEGPLAGIVGKMQDELEEMKRWFLGLLTGWLLNVGGIILVYLLTRK